MLQATLAQLGAWKPQGDRTSPAREREPRGTRPRMYGNTAETLLDFGLEAPRPRTPLTTEQRLAAAAKARATRVARGTKSRKQRLAIKGDVTGVVVTAVTAEDRHR